jgi:hypothetical protein
MSLGWDIPDEKQVVLHGSRMFCGQAKSPANSLSFNQDILLQGRPWHHACPVLRSGRLGSRCVPERGEEK